MTRPTKPRAPAALLSTGALGYEPTADLGDEAAPVDRAAEAGIAYIPHVVAGEYFVENGAATGTNFTYAHPGGPGWNFPDYGYAEAAATGGVADGAGTSASNTIGWSVEAPCTVTIHTFDYGATPVTYNVTYGATTETNVPTGDKLIDLSAQSGTVAFSMGSFGPPGTKLGFDGYTLNAGGETFWVQAYNVNDGDDATFDYVLDEQTECLRVTLAEAYRIATAELRIAIENAGSVTYSIEGASQSDYSDAVELVSKGFTATGSYTAQDVSFTLPATSGYRYYRLIGPAENRRIHTLELYEATDSADVDAHIADTTAHTASAITFSPTGTIAATNVQSALAEVASEAVSDLAAHTGDTSDAHDASAISVLDTAGNFTGTDVEAVLAELAATGGATATHIWRPLMDGAGNVVTDSGTGEAVMAYGPA